MDILNNPWFQLPQDQVPSPMAGPMIAMIPPPKVEKPQKREVKREVAAEVKVPNPSAWMGMDETILQGVLGDVQGRKSSLSELEASIKGLPEKDPITWKNANLKPLMAFADSLAGTNYSRGYEAPKATEQAELRLKLKEIAEKEKQAIADDQIKLYEALAKGQQSDEMMKLRERQMELMAALAGDRNEIARLRAEKEKAPSGQAWSAAGFARRIQQTSDILDSLSKEGYLGLSRGDQVRSYLPAELQNERAQKYDQAARNFINATLREESGAAIADSEFENAYRQYLPRPGDSPEVLAQKRANRMQVFENFKAEGGSAFERTPYISPLSAQVAPPAQAGRVTVTNGKEIVEIDAKDLMAAQADGFQVMR